jgi:TRAP-type C4-dicarboxylate transport system permease small subunit
MLQLDEKTLSRHSRAVLWISRVMAVISAVVLGIMMVNTVADVCGRYFFTSPIDGTYELVGIMLIIAACFGLGYCQLNKANIRITVLSDLLPPRGQSIVNLISYIICAIGSGVICWQGWLRMYEYMFKGIGSTSATLNLPLWPFMLALSVGFGWVCLIFLIDVYLSFLEVFKHGTD